LETGINSRFDLLWPFGLIVSIGVPQDPLPFSGPECYAKNLRLQFGRCPVRGLFPNALATLVEIQEELLDFVEVWPGLEDAPKAYELFDRGEVGKIVFDLRTSQLT
jgi:threonine dehydrogenase-like Zn-dependent dehydrogenase